MCETSKYPILNNLKFKNHVKSRYATKNLIYVGRQPKQAQQNYCIGIVYNGGGTIAGTTAELL